MFEVHLRCSRCRLDRLVRPNGFSDGQVEGNFYSGPMYVIDPCPCGKENTEARKAEETVEESFEQK